MSSRYLAYTAAAAAVAAGALVMSGVTDPKHGRPTGQRLADGDSVTNAEGLRLYVRRWLVANARAVVFVSHGFAEHIGRYEHVAAALNARGFSVIGLDHQGHGRSEGDRAYFEEFSNLVDDFWLMVDHESVALGSLPKLLLGHSMGGLIAIRVAQRRPDYFRAVALSGPLIFPDPEAAKPHLIAVAQFLTKVVPKLPVEKLDSTAVSRDPKVVAAYINDPLVYKGGLRVRVGAQFLSTMEAVKNEIKSIKWPFLIIHGGSDKLTAPTGSQFFFENAASEDKALDMKPGLAHEIMNEPEQNEIIAQFAEFFEKRL